MRPCKHAMAFDTVRIQTTQKAFSKVYIKST